MTSLSGTGRHRVDPSTKIRRGTTQVMGNLRYSSATRRNLSRSVVEFFSKLRPSKRPERGGTLRPTTENTEARSRSCERKSPSSISRHDSDAIPSNCWNTPTTLPRRVWGVGARERAPVIGTGSFVSGRDAGLTETSPPRSLQHAHDGGHIHACYNPHPNLAPSATNSPVRVGPSYHHHRFAPPPEPPSMPPTVTPLTQSQDSHDVLVARRALRRRRQHTLISSGDFLGVTGANPYTGEPDIITPPTPSDDAIVTTSTSSFLPPSSPPLNFPTGTNTATPGSGGADGESSKSNSSRPAGLILSTAQPQQVEPARGHGDEDKAGRRLRREEERLYRAEQRKVALRETLERSGIRWRQEECGWSSVAEPRSPSLIQQSPLESGKPAAVAPGTCADDIGHAPANEERFLGLAAAATKPASSSRCHSRRRRRRHLGANKGIMKLMGRFAVVTSPEEQYGRAGLGTVVGEEEDITKGMCRLGKVMVQLDVPPPPLHPRRSPPQIGSSHLDHQQVWDLDSLVVVPGGLPRLSRDCRARKMSSHRVPKLHGLGSIDVPEGSQPYVVDGPSSGNGLQIKRGPGEIVHCPDRAPQYACTRTITTTGFGQQHGQPHNRAIARPCDAMRDRWHEARPDPGASMRRAHSQLTSLQSLTTILSDVCFTRPASPSSMRPSVWPSLNGPGLRRAMAMVIPKKMERRPGLKSPILLPPLVLGAGSDMTSSLTEQETAVHVQGHHHFATVSQPAIGDGNRSPRQRYWRMRETMRKSALLGEPNLDDKAGTGASSPTYTHTSIRCTTEQPWTLQSAIPRWQQGNRMCARGAARAAFIQGVQRE
ncbi:hypothetical protein VTH82DRAFT_4211 [Thermothelomyces myriococcoides]